MAISRAWDFAFSLSNVCLLVQKSQITCRAAVRVIGAISVQFVLLVGAAWGDSDLPTSQEAVLVAAAEDGNDQEIRHLLALGVDVNSKYIVRAQFSAAAIREFTAQGIDIQKRFIVLTALTGAVTRNHISTVKLLLASGANPNLSNSYGAPLLLAITSTGGADLVKMLLENGANANIESAAPSKETPIIALADAAKPPESTQVEMARQLIKFGAAVDMPDASGATALIKAIDHYKLLLVKSLLVAGANPNKVRDPKTIQITEADVPLQEAVTLSALHKDVSMTRLLLDYGADPNYRNDKVYYDTNGPDNWWNGTSVLAAVAKYGDYEIAKLLLDRGANPCLVRTDGLLPYAIAVNSGHGKTARLIMSYMKTQFCVPGINAKRNTVR